jgi:mono/diheme cytochrome c family protein
MTRRRLRPVGRAALALVLTLAAVGGGACGRKEPAAVGPAAATPVSAGERVYQQYCAACHMPDGGGVANFQPPLRGSAIVAGDPAKLEAVIRAGSAALRDREPLYNSEMPPFGMLTDEEVRSTVEYVRTRFGPAAPLADGKTP